MDAPLNLLKNSRTSSVLPDGRTVPLAWDLTTGVLMMKVAPYMPWSSRDGGAAVAKMVAAEGVYLADGDDWFRGVWQPAPTNILTANYTRNLQRNLMGPTRTLQLTEGGYRHGTGSTIIEGEVEPDEPEDPDEPEGEAGDGEAGDSEPTQAQMRDADRQLRKHYEPAEKPKKKKKVAR